ncbi:exosortase/archaeosortase family protein [Tautonia sociabilis]|uniref:Exosortase n=1 Tax=Tautonia sociabilis TaxID=2080755 RepID=A0A432ML50_9BACT|nr:exosortase/archaeosortase family protein [Tautonia sociabilis]RUL88154.1 exosortase [Tautonia sociabilis]
MATSTLPARDEAPPPRELPPLLARLRDSWTDSDGRLALLGASACLTLLALTFRSTLWHFAFVWATDQNYSHGFLVPLISLYFANSAARLGPVPYRPAVLLGSTLLVVALLGRLATIVVPVGFVGDLSFLAGLAGIVALFAGRGALHRFGFALTFLVFMVPLPIHLYTAIASPLQLLVSKVAATILNGTGLPVLCEGNHLTLPGGVRMFVAEACSGMRQLTGFLALTTAVAFLSPRPRWYRAVLIGSAIPVALTANVARVVLTGWIMAHDPRLAQGTFHTLEGLLLMGFGLALLRLECAVLNALIEDAPGPEAPGPQAGATAPHLPPSPGASHRPTGISQFRTPPEPAPQ